jgi:tyrosinase
MAASAGDPANLERLERDDLLHRKNAALLSGDEIAALRRAWEQIKEISETVRSDNRGFFEHAGLHGVPYWLCPHHLPERLFLPWHRAYLYRLEQALQDQVAGVTLPWWDWTTTREIPGPFADAQVDGAENTLFGTHTLVTEADQRRGRDVVDETFRDTHDPRSLPRGDQLDAVLAEPNFVVLSDALENVHDGVHGWTDGTMGDVAYAAFDPVFWAHHCMIDRVWWLWQQDNRINAVPVAGWEDIVLEPFNMTVGDTLIANSLGYEYADTETALDFDVRSDGDARRIVTAPVDVTDIVRSGDFRRADLEIGGIRHTGSSYDAWVYFNHPDADQQTGTEDPGYVGSFTVFGHGGCFGAEGHCDAPDTRRRFDRRPLSRAIRMKKRVTLTDALLAARADGGQLQITVVGTPIAGSSPAAEPEGVLDIKRVSVVVYR